MRVLGIETSCDETGVAVYESGRGIRAEALASQVALHAPYGGIVPELASRDHIAKLATLVDAVLDEADIALSDLDAIAYTAGPGLIGALMVGGAFAASTAYALGIPAVPVHHMEAHLLVGRLEAETLDFPFVALLVSGGHSMLVDVAGLGRYRLLGSTLDDAAGEAFDKVARLLGLPYPGGPALARLADRGDPARYEFPRPLIDRGLDMSFSGLKTAVRRVVEAEKAEQGGRLDAGTAENLAAAFQASVVETLVAKCARAVAETGYGRLVIAGGVGANQSLREQLAAWGVKTGVAVHYPRPAFCTDNGAMIAYAGAARLRPGLECRPGIVARPRWPLEELGPPGDSEH
ncbi:MAG TPA: tRNA (adenosine(37)-N6)-threonylcarbamoyltransferase complex transferase subunit TsaD [Gammaproteobacteria bacterium]|nr:tRNA (adenosine(37)-N6)-threonylcarbamoyltransferase complex transferase subunit TsaD [Gammaproteobacteria bacterium]